MKKPSGVQTDGSTQSLVDVAAIDQLARIVSQYDLSEIEISLGDLQVRLAREREPAAYANPAGIPRSGGQSRPATRQVRPLLRLRRARLRPILRAL